MQTRFFTKGTITQAAHLLRSGELVAFPTETVYGLGADATNSKAVNAIFKAKGRHSDNPLIVHVASLLQIDLVTNGWSENRQKLAESFWPGPLTIVSSRHPSLSPFVSAGLETVGIRVPDHPLALEFLALVGRPVAAPSANLSGRPSPTSYEMVAHDLSGKIAGILRTKEKLTFGIESTVVSLDEKRKILFLLREGSLTKEDLGEVLPDFRIKEGIEEEERASPGTRYAHYQPSVPVKLFAYEETLDPAKIPSLEKIAILNWQNSPELSKNLTKEGWQKSCSQEPQIKVLKKGERILLLVTFADLKDYAKGYYETLFKTEQAGCVLILAQNCPEEWIGRALKNRLSKSSASQWL